MSAPLPDLDALEAKARAATPGPWTFASGFVYGPPHGVPNAVHRKQLLYMADVGSSCDGCTTWTTRANDGQYIAAASPECVLALIEEVRRLQQENRQLESELAVVDGRASFIHHVPVSRP